MDSSISAQKKAEGRKATSDGNYTLRDHYLDQIQLVPGLKVLLEEATLKEDGEHYVIRSAADYSYAADKYAGDHYRIIGDASGRFPKSNAARQKGLTTEQLSSIHFFPVVFISPSLEA